MPEKEEKSEKETKKSEKKSRNKDNFMVIVVLAVVAILALVVAYGGITGNAIFSGGEVKIGFMGPLTGDAASYGHGIKRGVELALKDSGLENVRLIFEDTKCDGKEAVSAINKLINVDGVVAVVGEVCSGATLAAAPIAEQNKIVMISASSTSPQITTAGEYIFRVVPSDALQGRFGAQLVYDEGKRNLSILYGNEEYGIGFKEVLEKSFTELGGNVVATETFERGSVDLRTQIAKIRQAKPDAVYIISNSPDSAVAALKQLKQLAIRAKIYGSEGLKGPEVAQTKAAEGLIVTSVSVGTADFAKKYNDAYGLAVEPFAPQAYDAFSALANAMKDGAKTSEQIKEKLKVMSFNGVSGFIKFDENGDVEGNYEVYELKNSTFVPKIVQRSGEAQSVSDITLVLNATTAAVY